MATVRTPEEVAEQTRQAVAQLATITTVDELRVWWKEHYLGLGHKRLARLAILGWPLERVLADKSKGE